MDSASSATRPRLSKLRSDGAPWRDAPLSCELWQTTQRDATTCRPAICWLLELAGQSPSSSPPHPPTTIPSNTIVSKIRTAHEYHKGRVRRQHTPDRAFRNHRLASLMNDAQLASAGTGIPAQRL